MSRAVRSLSVVVCLALICIPIALAQTASSSNDASDSADPNISPVAYVYVSSGNKSTEQYQINAYAANGSGKLTPVLGSPFPSQIQYMALNGKWLFGTNGVYIDSFSIASNGALALTSSINATDLGPDGPVGGPANLFLDHTGATLYDGDYYGYIDGQNGYQSFAIDQSNGSLNYLGITPQGLMIGNVLSFIGNNNYAYSASCYNPEGPTFSPIIYGYSRNSSGPLNQLNITPPIPAAAASDEVYCPLLAAADPTNHVAISMTPSSSSQYSVAGPPQLAVYTADTFGNLTTSSTSANMPKTLVTQITDFWMSPSGKLLAVAGKGGLEVFHFNGANPITHYTGLLTKDEIDQVFWDKNNHLYAVSQTAGKLYVFTVTAKTHKPAPGSPYSIPEAIFLSVLPE
jgi:hypothetical protein